MELTDFLLARIAEDKAVAAEVQAYRAENLAPQYLSEPGRYVEPNVDVAGPDVRIGVDRFLDECEAKRRTLALLDEVNEQGIPRLTIYTRELLPRLLALPYADHPDYREEWKP